jgi:hypothetical protein
MDSPADVIPQKRAKRFEGPYETWTSVCTDARSARAE